MSNPESAPELHPLLTRERVLVGALTLLTVVTGWFVVEIVAPFVAPLTWALVLAVVLQPLHRRLRSRMSSRPAVAVLAVTIVAAGITLPTGYVAQQIAREVAAQSARVKTALSGDHWRDAISGMPRVGAVATWIEEEVDVRPQLEAAVQRVVEGARKVLAGSLYVGTGLLVTLYLLFFFLRDQEKVLGAFRRYLPLAPHESDLVFSALAGTVYAVVWGTLVVSLLQGALGGLAFWWLGLPAPLVWGAVMAFLSLLPVFGAALVWGPVAVYLALTGNWPHALMLFAWGTIVIGLSDNVLRPLLIRDRAHMHTMVVFVAMLGGLAAFGGSGLVLGPLVVAFMIVLLRIWRDRMERCEGVEHGIDAKRPTA